MFSAIEFQNASEGIFPGPDLEWFAGVERGNVGAFCNAGFAVVPATVFAWFALYTHIIDLVNSLQRTGDAICIVRSPKFTTHGTVGRNVDYSALIGITALSEGYCD